MNMKTVTDDEFRENLSEILDYLSSGGSVVITAQGGKDVVLAGSDLCPEIRAGLGKTKKLRDQINKMKQPLLINAVRDLEKRHPALVAQRKKGLSFEDAMKRTREKHADIIKKLEDN